MDRPKNAAALSHSAAARVCASCREYSAHIDHGGLLYDHFIDGDPATGTYHRHVVYCPDLVFSSALALEEGQDEEMCHVGHPERP